MKMEPNTANDGDVTGNMRCALSRCSHTDDPILKMRSLLFDSVWKPLSPHWPMENPLELSEFAWMVTACAYSGCIDALNVLLHVYCDLQEIDYRQDDSSLADVMKDLVNQRTVCRFPFPDTWIHRTLPLAVTPLHMACWRLDRRMIQALLHLGADPNALAWEYLDPPLESGRQDTELLSKQSDATNRTDCSSTAEERESAGADSMDTEESCGVQNPDVVEVDGDKFYCHQGMSPLGFVALGLRAPPMYSLNIVSKGNAFHEASDNYHAKLLCSPNFEPCHVQLCCLCHSLTSSNCYKNNISNMQISKDDKEDLVLRCLKLLLSSGANPNLGGIKYLDYALPLDIFIQPPIQMFHFSNTARISQAGVNLRRNDFLQNMSLIISVCHELLLYNAKLSPTFVSLHKWKPQHLDCFSVQFSQQALEMVKIVAKLGLFSPSISDSNSVEYSFKLSFYLRAVEDSSGRVDFNPTSLHYDVATFIAGVTNTESPIEFVSVVFQWCSVSAVSIFCDLATKMIERSEFELDYLRELVQIAQGNQFRSLKHSSMLVILKSFNANQSAIQTLPLPDPLKRQLQYLTF